MQGYLISKPIPIDDLEMLLRGELPGASEFDHTAHHHLLLDDKKT